MAGPNPNSELLSPRLTGATTSRWLLARHAVAKGAARMKSFGPAAEAQSKTAWVFWIASALFLVSGASGLVYQVTSFTRFSHIWGKSRFAVWTFFATALSSGIVIAGVLTAPSFVHPLKGPAGSAAAPTLAWTRPFTNWDGASYVRIATEGYSYSPGGRSLVAFFPAYPLVGSQLSHVLHLGSAESLLLISNVSVFVAAWLFVVYLREGGRAESPRTLRVSCLAFLLFPTSVFWRMSYTEALFVASVLLAFVAMQRNWPSPFTALVVGFATAVRPVGVALVLPFVIHLSRQLTGWKARLGHGAYLIPLALWGLLEYMIYLRLEFGDAFAFAKSQRHWWSRPPNSWSEYLTAHATLEPLWSVYVHGSLAHWRRGPSENPLLSLEFANPLYFAFAGGLVTLGAAKKWLTTEELALSGGLLLIPYVLHGYQTCFIAQGRYASVVFPVYIVLGRLLTAVAWPVRAAALACCGALLFVYAALFASFYPII